MQFQKFIFIKNTFDLDLDLPRAGDVGLGAGVTAAADFWASPGKSFDVIDPYMPEPLPINIQEAQNNACFILFFSKIHLVLHKFIACNINIATFFEFIFQQNIHT